MAMELSILPHQEDFLKAIRKAFEDIRVEKGAMHENPIINLNDGRIKGNIENLWEGYEDLQAIPKAWRTRDEEDYLGIDIRMETGARVIIVTGCIKLLVSRVSGTSINNNSCIS